MFRRTVTATILIGGLTTGCTIQPEPLSEAENLARVVELKNTLADKWAPDSGEVDLFVAVEQALTRNFEIVAARQALDLQRATLDDVILGHLPRGHLTGRVTKRSNPDSSANSTTASDLKRRLGSAEATWSVLSFGQAYLRSKQQANNVLVKHEESRRTANEIVVRAVETYLHAEMAQQLLPDVKGFLADLDKYELRAENYATKQLIDPVDVLVFRIRLVNLKKTLRLLREELTQRRILLATLIGSRKTSLRIKSSGGAVPKVVLSDISLEDLENAALLHRPELHISAYRKRNAALGVKSTYLSLIPDISAAVGANFDSNSILLNNSYTRFDLSATYNLLNLLRFPARLQVSKANLTQEELRELIFAVSVVEQVRLAYADWKRLRRVWKTERQNAGLWRDVRKIRSDRTVFEPLDKLRLIETQASAMSAQVDLAKAQTQYFVGMLRLIQSIGINLYPAEALTAGLDPLGRQLRAHWKMIPRMIESRRQAAGSWRRRSWPAIPVMVLRLRGLPS
ncbi:MAG: TolC family protein [Actinomycetota bacterium]